MSPFQSWIKQAIKAQVSTSVLLNHPISELNPQNPPGTVSWASNWPLQRKTLSHIENPNKFQALHCVSQPNKTFHMFWYQKSFGRVVGSALQTVRAASKAASYLSEVILSNHPPKRIAYEAPNNFITTYIKARLWSCSDLWETWKASVSRCAALPLSPRSFDPQPLPASVSFFSPLFVSPPVFIKLVKFPLQLCQPCIMLCCSHHRALQLPGNWVWRRHVKRQRTPTDTK